MVNTGGGGSSLLNIIIIINNSGRIEELFRHLPLKQATNKSNFSRSFAILQFCAKCITVLARELL